MYELALLIDQGTTRNRNDDRACINALALGEGQYSGVVEGELVAAVFDGVGGAKGGDAAAQQAAEVLAEWYRTAIKERPDPITDEQGLKEALGRQFDAINTRLLRLQKSKPGYRRASTTVAGMAVVGGDLLIMNAGDSRVYRFRDGLLSQMTTDHSIVQEMVDSGFAYNEQHYRNVAHIIKRYLGDSRRSRGLVEFAERSGIATTGDLFLLCSDGLTDVVAAAEIESLLATATDLPEACAALVQAAKLNGSTDNITVLLVRVL
jgi:serine/threonine protein phosphatase PrpC